MTRLKQTFKKALIKLALLGRKPVVIELATSSEKSWQRITDLLFALLSKKFEVLLIEPSPSINPALNRFFSRSLAIIMPQGYGNLNLTGWKNFCLIENGAVLAGKNIKGSMKRNVAFIASEDSLRRSRLPKEVKFMSFGFGENCQLRATDLNRTEEGFSFKIRSQGSLVPLRITNKDLNESEIYNILLTASLGLDLKMHLVEIAQILENYYNRG